MNDQETPEQKAIRLLKRQLEELQTIRGLNYRRAEFKAWRDSTRSILDRYLGPEEHLSRTFRNLMFFGQTIVTAYGGFAPPPDYISPDDADAFRNACETSDATLRATIRHVEDFGLYVEQPKPAPARKGRRGNGGGVTQTFHAHTVTIGQQAIATNNAIQDIGQMGDQTIGASLNEIAELLKQSEDLTPRQLKDGLANIEVVAIEEQKPEAKRDWKAVFERGSAILGLIEKATDVAHKLAPYTPAIIALMDQAKHYIK